MSMLKFFTSGRAAHDVRLMAATGELQAPTGELLSILVLLLDDEDADVRQAAASTLDRLPRDSIHAFLSTADVPARVRQYFAAERLAVSAAPPPPASEPRNPVDAVVEDAEAPDDPELTDDDRADRDSIVQKLSKMGFSERLKAAARGSREVRSILIRDPSRMIAMAVLNSPKVTEPEVEGFARMGNVSEDVLRAIGTRRAWLKNYGVVVALTKNAKTPLAISLNLMNRLTDRDLAQLSNDRNIPDPLRVAARKKVVSTVSR
jgi:hypothetical protein